MTRGSSAAAATVVALLMAACGSSKSGSTSTLTGQKPSAVTSPTPATRSSVLKTVSSGPAPTGPAGPSASHPGLTVQGNGQRCLVSGSAISRFYSLVDENPQVGTPADHGIACAWNVAGGNLLAVATHPGDSVAKETKACRHRYSIAISGLPQSTSICDTGISAQPEVAGFVPIGGGTLSVVYDLDPSTQPSQADADSIAHLLRSILIGR